MGGHILAGDKLSIIESEYKARKYLEAPTVKKKIGTGTDGAIKDLISLDNWFGACREIVAVLEEIQFVMEVMHGTSIDVEDKTKLFAGTEVVRGVIQDAVLESGGKLTKVQVNTLDVGLTGKKSAKVKDFWLSNAVTPAKMRKIFDVLHKTAVHFGLFSERDYADFSGNFEYVADECTENMTKRVTKNKLGDLSVAFRNEVIFNLYKVRDARDKMMDGLDVNIDFNHTLGGILMVASLKYKKVETYDDIAWVLDKFGIKLEPRLWGALLESLTGDVALEAQEVGKIIKALHDTCIALDIFTEDEYENYDNRISR